MSVKGQIKEAAGYVKEEAHEHGKSAKSQEKALEGRELRNEGRIEDGKAPKTDKPGTDHWNAFRLKMSPVFNAGDIFLLAGRSHAPDHAADIIGDQKCTLALERQADRPAGLWSPSINPVTISSAVSKSLLLSMCRL
jgi:hypothetical protein